MLICFDLETTGLDKKYDQIIEVAMVKFDEKTFEILDTYSTFVNPWVPIPELISNITNIFDSDVENAPKFSKLKSEITEFIGDTPVLWHNVNFDKDFFVNNWIPIENQVCVDTFFLANILCYNVASLNLEVLCKHFWIPFSWAHRALNDVHATINLYQKLLEAFSNLDENKKNLIAYIFQNTEDKHLDYLRYQLFEDVFDKETFENFEKSLLDTIGKDIDISELVVDKKLKVQKMDKYFQMLWSVEKRENQSKMTDIVFETLQDEKRTVIEAPTWLGKSFAYLIPSIVHSVKTWEKVYISTKTKNLQEQLYVKDLHFLSEKLDFDFRYCKLKWKRNYLSIKSFFDQFLLWGLEYDQVSFLSKLSLWLMETKYWELDELNFFGVEFHYLKLIQADSVQLMTEKNPYKDYEFLAKARSQVDRSNIIIINHSLLFSDLKGENSVLWKVDNLVIDEAHNIEDSLTDALKQSIWEKSLKEIFDTIEKILVKANINKIEFLKLKEQFFAQIDLVIDYGASYINGKNPGNLVYKNWLVQRDFFEEANFDDTTKKITLALMDIVDHLATIWDFDFSSEISYLQAIQENCRIFFDKESDKNYIKMISVHEKFWVQLEFTLLNPGEYLIDSLWETAHSVVLTSATLQIGNTFDYYKQILSLQDFEFHAFLSDFDYKKQSTVIIPTDLWSIKNNSEEIVSFLGKFYQIVRWKTLTLLTSFNIIRKIYTGLNKDLQKEWIKLYAQSITGSKNKLMNFYLDEPDNSILLWTDSFWEWVDIPGENLKYLIIHKFPFSVPNDPIFQARSVFFKDSFKEYAIPKAIIKLKQWFWRLIRSKNDTWIVILLDDRIYSTKWWDMFYSAFPEGINVKTVSSESFLKILEKKV